ncbi:hypothetical protein MKS88_004108 [Plasmodium brasilianum]|uniref:Uncharacterized protein n=1 Tax=Plasmodium brasilianum TaxID=5824 RepID=A0ACB9Y570_PLABR|nr:hypothetical protein MKS88_004108 [Plasmodium brasilianum]
MKKNCTIKNSSTKVCDVKGKKTEQYMHISKEGPFQNYKIMLKKGKATKQNENDLEIENILIRGNLSEKELKNMDLSTLRSMSKDHNSQLTYQLLDLLMNNL